MKDTNKKDQTELLKFVEAATSSIIEQSKLINSKAEGDHDLLIRLETKMEGLKTDIKDIKDGTATQIADHEVRINSLETSKTKQNTMMAIGIGILTLLVSLLVYHLIGK